MAPNTPSRRGLGFGNVAMLGTGKRHRRVLRDNILGITKPAIRRMARRGGVVRIQRDVYDAARKAVRDRLALIIGRIIDILETTNSQNRQRKTVTSRDVVFVLRGLGNPIYGFD